MATIKVKFLPDSDPSRQGVICYLISHDRRLRSISSPHRLFPEEWSFKHASIIFPSSRLRRDYLHHIHLLIACDLRRLNHIIARLDDSGFHYTTDDVVNEYWNFRSQFSLSSFMQSIIDRLRLNNKLRTSETYRSALNSFMSFRHGEDLPLDYISSDLIEEYEAWLKSRGLQLNTISFYLRILRAAYNRAVDLGAIEDIHPFRHVYTGIDKTMKRALPLSAIKRIKGLDLAAFPALAFARDMFLLSFYLRGMSFIDMCYLRKADLRDGFIIYRRRKTGQQLVIQWTRDMQTILDHYPKNTSGYLLPIIRRRDGNERLCYRNVGYNINYNLRKVAAMAKLNFRLTMYVARHSWASAAKAKGIPLSVISVGMGHTSESTTRIYLADLDTSIVDRANSQILKDLR
ncbi:MAG: tyrosine-type recombinase/integrase [Lepagella sp.]